MSSHDMKNPNGGVSMGHVIELPDPIIIRLRPDKLCETPRADPHADSAQAVKMIKDEQHLLKCLRSIDLSFFLQP